jgi:hypothetical protein
MFTLQYLDLRETDESNAEIILSNKPLAICILSKMCIYNVKSIKNLFGSVD